MFFEHCVLNALNVQIPLCLISFRFSQTDRIRKKRVNFSRKKSSSEKFILAHYVKYANTYLSLASSKVSVRTYSSPQFYFEGSLSRAK